MSMQHILNLTSSIFGRKKKTEQGAGTQTLPRPTKAHSYLNEVREYDRSFPASPFRDPLDQQLNFKLSALALTTSLMLLLSLGGNLYQYMRKPTIVLLNGSNGDAVMVDDQLINTTPAAKLERERIGFLAKKSATETYLELIYRIDPNREVRLKDVARGLKMLHPFSAAKLGQLLDQKQIITRQLAEAQQSTWTVKDYSVDKRDPYLTHVVAEQVVTRTPPGATVPETETFQCIVKVKLRPDPDGRTAENANTGLQILAYDFKVIPSGQGPRSAIEGYNLSPSTESVRVGAPPAAGNQSIETSTVDQNLTAPPTGR